MASFASAGPLPAALQRGELVPRPCSSLQCRASARHGAAPARRSSSSLHRSSRSRGSTLRLSAQQTSTEPAGTPADLATSCTHAQPLAGLQLRDTRHDCGISTLTNLLMAGPVTDKDFQELVLDSPVPVIVDYWAPWCGPCRMIAPMIDEIAVEYGDKLRAVRPTLFLLCSWFFLSV